MATQGFARRLAPARFTLGWDDGAPSALVSKPANSKAAFPHLFEMWGTGQTMTVYGLLGCYAL